jgi:hypothetical protein
MSLLTLHGKKKATPDEVAENSIKILAERKGISYGEARSHIRKLFRQYGGSTEVLNECLDRDLMINLR